MCEAKVCLNSREIMRDVMRVEFLPEGVRLSAAFEEPWVVPAVIREIDLVNPRVMLESP
jgi:predicted RNA-binding protein